MRWMLLAALLVVPALSGCVYDEDADVKIAYTYKLTDLVSDKDPRRLADWVGSQSGLSATVYDIDDSGAALEALRFGHADIAFVDGAAGWLGVQRFGLDVIAADQKADGRTFYMASAWVRADSPYQNLADLRGADSCHTGRLKSAGMFMPIAALVNEGLLDVTTYANEIQSVEQMTEDYFGTATVGGAYGGYEGSLRCLSEGVGDVAFVRDTTPADYCGEGGPAWCLDLSEYRLLAELGPVPSHPVMVSPHVDAEKREAITQALLKLNDSPKGRAILSEVLETPGITRTTTEEHLATYGGLLAVLPGMAAYNEKKYT